VRGNAHFFAGLMTTIALSVGVTHAFAADLVVLDQAAQSSLKASANANVVSTLSILRKQAQQHGSIRIIVGLRIVFVPEGGLTEAAALQQRDEIARVQSVVLDKVPSLKLRPESIKRFASSPFLALEVNSAELEALASLNEIVSIEEDRIAAPSSASEVVLPESK
jgi:hypothetical protein